MPQDKCEETLGMANIREGRQSEIPAQTQDRQIKLGNLFIGPRVQFPQLPLHLPPGEVLFRERLVSQQAFITLGYGPAELFCGFSELDKGGRPAFSGGGSNAK